MQLSTLQEEYFIVVMSLLFFTALFKDIYSTHHFPSLPSQALKKPPLKPKRMYEKKQNQRCPVLDPNSVKEAGDF